MGPVIITDASKPAYVLLSFENYQRLIRQHHNIADVLGMPRVADIEFEPAARNYHGTTGRLPLSGEA